MMNNMGDMTEIREVAVEAARKAGTYALSHMERIGKISHKQGYGNLVTDIDKGCENIIIDRIKKDFPSHSVLAEESGGEIREEEFSWIIDPIDGTTNYTHGFPVFCTSIGVMKGNMVRLGVVYDPSRDELFFAEEGKGAFLNDRKIGVSGIESFQDSLIATGFAYNYEGKVEVLPYFDKILKHAQAVRRAGSAALDLCYVACGRLDGFWEFGLYPWDTAAGLIIVKEAGGSVTTLEGTPYGIFEKEIVATNGRIQDAMLGLLNS